MVAVLQRSTSESCDVVRLATFAPETERGRPSASMLMGYVGVSMYGRSVPSGSNALGFGCEPVKRVSDHETSRLPFVSTSTACHTTGAIS